MQKDCTAFEQFQRFPFVVAKAVISKGWQLAERIDLQKVRLAVLIGLQIQFHQLVGDLFFLHVPARHRCSCALTAVKGESHWPC